MNTRPRKIPTIDSKFAPFHLRVGRSRIHGWGVYAAETIPAGRKVIEYTGERLTYRQSWARLRKLYRNPRTRRLSIFRLNWYWRIDGAVDGSGADLINHSCEPNLRVRRIRGHILLFSVRRIRAKEELTLDYHLRRKAHRVRCRCGSPKCRGMINSK